jgi:hypothetical protein
VELSCASEFGTAQIPVVGGLGGCRSACGWKRGPPAAGHADQDGSCVTQTGAADSRSHTAVHPASGAAFGHLLLCVGDRAFEGGLVITTVLVVLYYLLPLDRPLDTGTAVRLLIGLLVFAGLAVWSVRAITGSRYPGLRAAEALGLIIPLYLLLFASTYFLMERASAGTFTQPLAAMRPCTRGSGKLARATDRKMRSHGRQGRERLRRPSTRFPYPAAPPAAASSAPPGAVT